MDTRDLRRERLADLTREAEEELPKADERWTRLPGGMIIERKDSYDLHRPVNLPANRHPLAHEFVIRWWMIGWTVCILACVLGVIWLA